MTPAGPELARKAAHLAMGGVALGLRWLTPGQAMLLALGAVAFNLLALDRLTRFRLLRRAERERGFSWGILLYPTVVFLLIAIFRHRLELAAGVWALLAFGDGMAAVTGLLVGGPRLPWNAGKTWAGWAAFVLYGTGASALLIRWTQQAVPDNAGSGGVAVTWIGDSFLAGPGFLLAACFVAALAAACAESLESGLDDNIRVPLVGGTALYAATLVEPGILAAAGGTVGQQMGWGAVVTGVLAVAAVAARAATPSGALGGWVLGTALYGFGGWPVFLMLPAFVVLGTATTRLGHARKSALGIAQGGGGRRGARHAFANATAGVVCAFLAVATPHREIFLLASVAAFATAACDTVSSEIGKAYGRGHYLITTLRRVPAGTDGAVSVVGTLSGVLGALLLAAIARQTELLTTGGAGVVVLAAFTGGTLDSYLGATLERARAIDNEQVNFAATVAGAVTAIVIQRLIVG